jgi:hypothetical protein
MTRRAGSREKTKALSPEAPIPSDPRTVARVARLLKWYPRVWRTRYGVEFEAMLFDTFAAGRGGFVLSLDVVREGLIARVVESGLVGTVAPPLKRARASVAETFVGIVGFLAASTVLAHYFEEWRTFPVSAALERAQLFLQREERAAYLATHAQSVSPAQIPAVLRPYTLQIQRQLRGAYSTQASGVPVVFHQIFQAAVYAAVVGLVGILVVTFIGGITTTANRDRTRLVLPTALLTIAGALVVVSEVVSSSRLIPFSFTEQIHAAVEGRPWAWPYLAGTLSMLLGLIFLAGGGALLLFRAHLEVRLCRWVGHLATASAALLGCALVCLLVWSLSLSHQAPGFLFWSHQGLFGTSLLSVFVAIVLIMFATTALTIAGSTRCRIATVKSG